MTRLISTTLIWLMAICATAQELNDSLPSTMQPVTQCREPDTYDWMQRHETICQYVRDNQPRGVMFGNSITHYWGGEPSHPRHRRAKEVWDEIMVPLGCANLGCGWDRVENVLWRVKNGELDGYKPEYVVLLIGTNNFTLNTPEETAEGIRLIIKTIREHQPQTRIIVCGLLPRRDGEDWIAAVNDDMRAVAESEQCEWINPGLEMLTDDGKTNLTLFTDGLHPNKEGYKILALSIQKAIDPSQDQ